MTTEYKIAGLDVHKEMLAGLIAGECGGECSGNGKHLAPGIPVGAESSNGCPSAGAEVVMNAAQYWNQCGPS